MLAGWRGCVCGGWVHTASGLSSGNQVLQLFLCLISFLSLSDSKPNYTFKIWWYSTQPKVYILQSEMKEITSKDILWEVVKWSADLENCDWLLLLELRWLPVYSMSPGPSVAFWLLSVSKYCTPKPLSSSGSPCVTQVWSCSPAHAPGPSPALTHVYGSPLEWPLERSLVRSVIGMLGIRLKDRVTGCIAFISCWMWNLCTGSICCLFLQPEINGHKRLRKNSHLTWLRNVFCCIC